MILTPPRPQNSRRSSGRRRRRAIGWARDNKLELFRQQPLFRGCTRSEIIIAARWTDLTTLPAGQVVIRAGEPADYFYAIVHGSVLLSHRGEALAHLGDGDHFGDVGILGNGVNPTAATTCADTFALVAGRRELSTLIDRIPPFRDRVLAAMARRAGCASADPPRVASTHPARSSASPDIEHQAAASLRAL